MTIITRSRARSRVLLRFWNPFQVLFFVGWGLLFVVIVIGRALELGYVELGGVPFGVVGAVFALRASLLRIVVTETELVVHSWWRTSRFALDDVADLRPVPYDGFFVQGGSSWIWSQLQLTTRDGREHDLRAVITVKATGKARSFCDKLRKRPSRSARRAVYRLQR